MKRIEDVEQRAKQEMSELAKTYFSAEAGSEENRKINEKALTRYRIIPRVFRDVSLVQTETTLLSSKSPYPIAVAPTGCHHLAHPAAESAVATACAKEGLIMTVSFMSSATIEEIAEVAPHSPKWLQIYICNDRKITTDIIKRAENSGFTALVVTVDSPQGGLWKSYLPDNFPELIRDKQGINLPKPMRYLLDQSMTSEAIRWLKSITKLPVVAKGIMRGEDAVEAARQGASAIIVSNHGARQIDGVCPSIDVLEEVVRAVKGYEVEVYFDGGIRTGSDVFRALALGAKAIFIGRPIVWGLSVGGEDGVRRVLEILKDEFRATMCLAGTATLQEITKEMIAKIDNYSKL